MDPTIIVKTKKTRYINVNKWTLWFIISEEVMFTEANGWGEHHFQGVDKSVSTEMKSLQLFY
jgi:carbamoylphosphate synthase large subunit